MDGHEHSGPRRWVVNLLLRCLRGLWLIFLLPLNGVVSLLYTLFPGLRLGEQSDAVGSHPEPLPHSGERIGEPPAGVGLPD